VPDYQAAVMLPASINDGGRRRGVPDVAALAAGNPGYRIVLNAQRKAKDGTSAATPLWAALILLAVAARGQRIGLIQPVLYANPDLFRPIATGNNRVDGVGYASGPGWNACCGLGAPLADRIIARLAAMV
jgi:kumamolisin